MTFITKSYIQCQYCSQSAPLKTEPVYDEAFKKTGEKYLCGFCKKEYEKDKIPFIKEKKPEKEGGAIDQTCQNCEFFAKNIFYIKCTRHNKTVNVYDSCNDFSEKKKKASKTI
jgi:hypothetical protein